MYFDFQKNTHIDSRYFEIDSSHQLQMHYQIIRNATPRTTFFIHGNLASNHWWYPYLNELDFSHKYPGDIILAEFRGCGKSSPPVDESEVNMVQFAQDFLKLILHLGYEEKINLVGHSTGGNIAALMLAMNPSLFHRAVLLDPVGPRGVKFDDKMIATFERMKQNKQLVSSVLGMTIYKNIETEFFKKVITEDGFTAVKAVGHLILKAFDGFNIVDKVKSIPHPTLVLHGELDNILALSESQYMAEIIPQGQFYKIPQQGHCLNLENPKLFKQLLHSFLFA